MDNKKHKLIEVLSIQSESYNQYRMFAYIVRELKRLGCTYYSHNGNLYATKGIADKYPCVVSHMDTVHDIGEDLTVLDIDGVLTGFNRFTMTQSGIGGDDKVGVFVCLQALASNDNIKAAFFRDEEVGCDGSYQADKDFFTDCRFVLQCDRRGNSDFVVNASGYELSNDLFQGDVLPIITKYGYSFSQGAMTDVMALKSLGIPCSVANMSCGYYNPHMDNEYVIIDDVFNTLDMVLDIIHELCDKNYDFVSIPKHKPIGFSNHSYNSYKSPSIKPAAYWDDWYETYDYNKSFGITDTFCEGCGVTHNVDDLKLAADVNAMVCKDCYELFEFK
jgi:hypothetical protein